MRSVLHPLIYVFLLLVSGSMSRSLAERKILVSVPEQKMVLLENGVQLGKYSVSTSRFGLGDQPRSYATPLGRLAVAGKVGAGAPMGMVFKGGRATGEILRPNQAGRDPIVTRILRLRGLDRGNAGALARGIYIHGTPVEGAIGRPASYGCIRMRSRDVMRIFDAVGVGTAVEIINASLRQGLAAQARRG